MGKRDREEPAVAEGPIDVARLARKFIASFNKDAKDKVAWNLALDEDCPTTVKDYISTGSTLLDAIVCNRMGGGVPVGKITEISGEEASGKSLIASHILANTQRKGGLAILLDTENAAERGFMQRVGVDTDKLVYMQPGTTEAVFETIEKCIAMARANDVSFPVTIVWDSVASTPPKAEIEGDFDPNSRIGLQAKTIAKGFRKLTEVVGRERITLVCTNQLKFRPGVMYGDPFITPGGKAIPYHASVRIRLTSKEKVKEQEGDDEAGKGAVVGVHTRAKVMKSRLGPPLRACEFDIRFDSGIDDVASWRAFLHEQKEIEKAAGYMHMRDAPQTVDGAVKVVPEIKFRERAWRGIVEADPAFREHVLSLIGRHLVVKFDAAAVDEADEPAADDPFRAVDGGGA